MSGYFAENVAFLRRNRKLSQQALADKLEVKRTSLSAYELGRTEPSLKVLQQLATEFNLTIDDLLNKQLSEDYFSIRNTVEQPSPLRILAITVDDEQRENIELVNEKAAAGYTYGYGDPEYVKNLPKFQLPWLKTGTYRAFQIQGDSMLPIVSGSIIVGEFVERISDLKKEEVYVFVTTNNGILFKRVSTLDKNQIVLKSDNRNFSSYALPLSEIREVWKAKLYMSSNFS